MGTAMGNKATKEPKPSDPEQVEAALDKDVVAVAAASKITIMINDANGAHKEAAIKVLPSELVFPSLRRELSSAWGPGELVGLWWDKNPENQKNHIRNCEHPGTKRWGPAKWEEIAG